MLLTLFVKSLATLGMTTLLYCFIVKPIENCNITTYNWVVFVVFELIILDALWFNIVDYS